MNDKSISHFYSTLFEYNYQSNLKILDAIEKQPTAFPQKVFFLYSHIQNAHHIWNGRISGNLSTYNVFQIHPLEQLRQLNEENFHLSFKLIQTTELDKEIHYTTSKGENFSNTVADILFHIINHSTYHRAQIATVFREIHHIPVSTDYIVFKR